MKNALIALIIISVVLCVLLLVPYSLHPSDSLPNSIDPVFYAWNLAYNAKSAFKGMTAATDTNILYPLTNTIAYSDTLWGQSLFASPVIWLTHNPVLAENLSVLLTFPLSALTMFALAYYVLRDPLASACSAIFFAFSYPRLAQIGHLPTVSSQWLPLYILFVLKYLREGKHSNLLLLFLSYLLALSSSIYFGVFLIPVTAVIFIADLVKNIRDKRVFIYKKLMLPLVIWAVPFAVLLGITVFPYIRLKAENTSIRRSIDDLTHLRAVPADYVSILPTSLISRFALPENINEHVLYPTVTVFLLAVAGFAYALRKKKFDGTVFAAVAVTAFVLSLGNEYLAYKMPYYYLYTYVPLFQTVRVPARFAIFVVLSLSVLAGYGILTIKRNKTWGVAAVSIAFILFLMEIWQIKTPAVAVPPANKFPPVYAKINQLPEPIRIAQLPLSLFYHQNSMESQLYKPYNLLTDADMYALETYRTYFSTAHFRPMVNGYSGYFPDSYNRLAETLENFPSDYSIGVLRDIGVTYAVVHMGAYEGSKKTDISDRLVRSPLLTLVYADDTDRIYEIHKK